jgi:fructose-1,6-bisphosphatase II
MPGRRETVPDRNFAFDLVRTTEAAALAAARWVGRGKKNEADGAAVDAMRLMFNTVAVDGIVVIGEGEKDEAPMLYNGEKVGTGEGPAVDIAVDPIDGTTLLSRGQGGALAVVAAAERGAMFDPGPCVYMEKIAAGPEGGKAIDITLSIEDNIRNVAKARKMEVQDITVTLLDRDRNQESVDRIRAIGARVHLIEHGDIAAAISAAKRGTGIDLLYGIGGTPEGVTAAAAIKCLGGEIQGRLWPRNDKEKQAAIDAGYDLSRVLTTEDLCAGEDVYFAATGLTDGVILEGVRYTSGGATSQSIVMRARTGTIRVIISDHRWDRLEKITGDKYHS